jgi:hypothetical protein
MNYVLRLDHGIQSERRAAFALAPATVATMYEERLRFHAIADKAAVAASIERKKIAGDHARDVLRIETRLAQHTENYGLRNLSARCYRPDQRQSSVGNRPARISIDATATGRFRAAIWPMSLTAPPGQQSFGAPDYDENHVLPERHEPFWIFLKTGPGSNRLRAKSVLFLALK